MFTKTLSQEGVFHIFGFQLKFPKNCLNDALITSNCLRRISDALENDIFFRKIAHD